MPAQTPPIAAKATAALNALGERVRARRKALGVSAVAAAEAGGMSRVTLHRIESGEPSVTIGAYANALAALDLELAAQALAGAADAAPAPVDAPEMNGWIPARVRLADYPQLRQLAWQVQGVDELTPVEALGIYERNWRHVDQAALAPREKALVDALRLALGDVGKDADHRHV